MKRTETVQAVINYLGRIAMILAVGAITLTFYLLWLAGKKGSVDPVAVGAVGSIIALLGTNLGALGALLVSTNTGPTEAEMAALAALAPKDAPLEVAGVGGGPVKTEEVEAT